MTIEYLPILQIDHVCLIAAAVASGFIHRIHGIKHRLAIVVEVILDEGVGHAAAGGGVAAARVGVPTPEDLRNDARYLLVDFDCIIVLLPPYLLARGTCLQNVPRPSVAQG